MRDSTGRVWRSWPSACMGVRITILLLLYESILFLVHRYNPNNTHFDPVFLVSIEHILEALSVSFAYAQKLRHAMPKSTFLRGTFVNSKRQSHGLPASWISYDYVEVKEFAPVEKLRAWKICWIGWLNSVMFHDIYYRAACPPRVWEEPPISGGPYDFLPALRLDPECPWPHLKTPDLPDPKTIGKVRCLRRLQRRW